MNVVLELSNTSVLSIPFVHSFSVAAPTIWNSLTPALRMYISPDAFCCHLKTHYSSRPSDLLSVCKLYLLCQLLLFSLCTFVRMVLRIRRVNLTWTRWRASWSRWYETGATKVKQNAFHAISPSLTPFYDCFHPIAGQSVKLPLPGYYMTDLQCCMLPCVCSVTMSLHCCTSFSVILLTFRGTACWGARIASFKVWLENDSR